MNMRVVKNLGFMEMFFQVKKVLKILSDDLPIKHIT